jgi:hypothetical protein
VDALAGMGQSTSAADGCKIVDAETARRRHNPGNARAEDRDLPEKEPENKRVIYE